MNEKEEKNVLHQHEEMIKKMKEQHEKHCSKLHFTQEQYDLWRSIGYKMKREKR